MFAPQVMYYKECLSGNHGLNGTAVESDKAIKLLDKLFEILDPIEPMGTDDNKRIWIWADRGSADDSWDYEDMLRAYLSFFFSTQRELRERFNRLKSIKHDKPKRQIIKGFN